MCTQCGLAGPASDNRRRPQELCRQAGERLRLYGLPQKIIEERPERRLPSLRQTHDTPQEPPLTTCRYKAVGISQIAHGPTALQVSVDTYTIKPLVQWRDDCFQYPRERIVTTSCWQTADVSRAGEVDFIEC